MPTLPPSDRQEAGASPQAEDQAKVTSELREQFAVVPQSLILGKAPAIAGWVYTYLDWRAGQSEKAWPGVRRIMADLGIGSEHTVLTAIRWLEEHGFLFVTKAKGNLNMYRLLTNPRRRSVAESATLPLQKVQHPVAESATPTVAESATKPDPLLTRSHNKRTTISAAKPRLAARKDEDLQAELDAVMAETAHPEGYRLLFDSMANGNKKKEVSVGKCLRLAGQLWGLEQEYRGDARREAAFGHGLQTAVSADEGRGVPNVTYVRKATEGALQRGDGAAVKRMDAGPRDKDWEEE